MDQDVIQAKRIELLDAPGRPSLVLTGRDEVGRAGLVMSSLEESSEVGASAVISFIEGRVLLSLRNADGSELTLTPQVGPQDPKDVARDTARDLAGVAGELAALKADARHWLTSSEYAVLHLRLENAHAAVEAALIEARRRVRINEERPEQ